MLRLFGGGGGDAKRRKTASTNSDNEFVHPESPGRRTLSRSNSSLSSASTPSIECSNIYQQLCAKKESVFQESDMRMVILDLEPRRTIFDSATIVPYKKCSPIPEPNIRLSNCKKFQLLRKRKDVGVITQLVWGAVPTPPGTDALKMHQLPDDEKFLISRTFGMEKFSRRDPRTTSESLASSDSESLYNSTIRSLDGLNRNSLTTTSQPEQFTRVRNSSLHLEHDAEADDFRTFSPPHRLSKNRRMMMSQKSSLCEPVLSPTLKSRSRLSSCGSQTEDENTRQVAIGIIFNNEFRQFIFQHIPLIETEMNRLETSVHTAASHSSSFLTNVYKAWEEFCTSLCNLYNFPRLRNPVWLSLVNKDLEDNEVAATFCDQLAALVDKFDTKDTKFFLSNVISAVLMHHMSWVASVASPEGAPTLKPLKGRDLLIGTTVNDESTFIPYNPYMAQFLEICGSIGNTQRSTKTVVCGSDSDELASILNVLSYFVRCSTVHHRASEDSTTKPLPISQSFSPRIAATPETSESLPSGLQDLKNLTFSPTIITIDDDLEVLSSTSSSSIPSAIESPISASLSDCLGRSLLAGPSYDFSPHFVLSGVVKRNGNFQEALSKIMDDVHRESSAVNRAAAVSLSQSTTSICEVQLPDAIVVMADTSDNSVRILSSDGIGEVNSPSESVVSMLEHFAHLHKAGTAPKFLISFIEDELVEILGKSLSLVEIVSNCSESSQQKMTPDRMRSVVGCDHSDLRLILNVASVYFPHVLSSVL